MLESNLIGANYVVPKKTRHWEDRETLSSSKEEDENEDALLAEATATAIKVPSQPIICDNPCTGDSECGRFAHENQEFLNRSERIVG
ncbi:hypothetical protein DVH05_009798 [Phytophthora capsici]|nr:hypothetical protein DVH05_009798 [Phytophthora capsici]